MRPAAVCAMFDQSNRDTNDIRGNGASPNILRTKKEAIDRHRQPEDLLQVSPKQSDDVESDDEEPTVPPVPS